MGTGYTNALEKMGFDMKRWMKENIIRGMGVCVTMRDDSYDLNSEEIADRLRHESGGYYEKALAEAAAVLAAAEARTQPEWEARALGLHQAERVEGAEKEKVYQERKEAHEKALEVAERMLARATGEVATGTCRFAVEQLQSTMSYDFSDAHAYGYPPPEAPSEWDDLRAREIEGIQKDIKNHTKYLDEDNARNADSLSAYIEWCEFVDQHFLSEE